jgi:hypothetical protein
MPEEQSPDNLRNLWQSQNMENAPMSLEQIREKARDYQRRIRWRNAREYAAIAATSIFFGWTIFRIPLAGMRAGAALCILGGWYVAYQIYRRARPRTAPADLALANCMEFYRRELVRQRDFLRGIWRWYLGPFVPGLAWLTVAAGVASPGHLPHVWRFLGGYALVAALAFLLIARMNLKAAGKLQKRIEEVNGWMGKPS